MESIIYGGFFKSLGEGGIFALGWVAFLWAMMQLRYERTRYQQLTVHIIQYFTKVNMLRDLESDPDLLTPGDSRGFHDANGGLGRIFDSQSDDLERLISGGGRKRRKRDR